MGIMNHIHKIAKTMSHDRLIYVAVVAGPIMTVPQVYDIWVKGQKQVSVVTWFSYLALSFIWLWYGIRRKDTPIILSQLVWIILDILIVVGVTR